MTIKQSLRNLLIADHRKITVLCWIYFDV